MFRDASLDAKNAFAVVKPPEQRRIGDLFLGGPVGHSENTAFTLSVKHDAEDTQSVVLATDPSGLVQANVANPYREALASASLTRQQGKSNTISIVTGYDDETQRNQVRILFGNEYETWENTSAAPKVIVLDAFTGGGAVAHRTSLHAHRHRQLDQRPAHAEGRFPDSRLEPAPV